MWSSWLPVQAYGYTGAKPYATFGPDVVRYSSTWQRPEWRYDISTGMVEYRGLCSLSVGKAGSFELVINYMDPTTGIPKITAGVKRMLSGMSNMADASWGTPVRCDLFTDDTTRPGSHHTVWYSVGNTAPIAGRWFWLGHTVSFLTDGDPDWFPWKPAIGGDTSNGWSIAMASRFSTSYSATWDAKVRCTKDYKRWQWTGLVRNSGGVMAGNPYDNLCVITHPNPQTFGNCLNTAGGEGAWAGSGGAIPVRIDNRQNAAGHQLDFVNLLTTYNPSWLQVELDYFTRP